MRSKPNTLARYLSAGAVALSVAYCPAASATFITSVSDAALTGATILDFNDQTGSFISRTINSAVTISAPVANGSLNFASTFCTDFGTTGRCLQTNVVSPMSATFAFTDPVVAFGFAINGLDTDWTLEAFSPSNVLLETDTIPEETLGGTVTGNDRRGFAGIALNSQIGSFRITGAFDFALIDDLHFVSAPAQGPGLPEPATLVLLGLGLGFARRRRTRQPA